MKAEQWMSRTVQTCRPGTSLNDAARLMWEHDCGILPVLEAGGRVVGAITDRDLCMCAYFSGKSLAELRVAEAMSNAVFTCRPEDTLEQVIRVMADHQVRRLPVIDARGKLVGLLSMNDLVRQLMSLEDGREHARLVTRLVEAQASICETRARETRAVVPKGERARATTVT
jgi:CBS domain-containing protein